MPVLTAPAAPAVPNARRALRVRPVHAAWSLAFVAAAVAAVSSGMPAAFAPLAALLPAFAAAEFDRTSGRLPDRLMAAVAATAVFAAAVGVAPVASVLSGAALAATPTLAVHLASPAAMGFGDVKLAASLGAALGVVDWRAGILLIAFASATALVAAAATRRTAIAFGPGLAVGAALALIVVTKGTI